MERKKTARGTACAACKQFRRRCAEDCPFSPYFPPNDPQKFRAVHKHFGATNFVKMLMKVPESQRAKAAESLIYEANKRVRDRAYGCTACILSFKHKLDKLQAELDEVRANISKYRSCEVVNTILSASSAASNTDATHSDSLGEMAGGSTAATVAAAGLTSMNTSTFSSVTVSVKPPPSPTGFTTSAANTSVKAEDPVLYEVHDFSLDSCATLGFDFDFDSIF